MKKFVNDTDTMLSESLDGFVAAHADILVLGPDRKFVRRRTLSPGKVALIFQSDRDDAYVALNGKAALIEDEAEVRRLWKRAYDPYFPNETDKANAAFVQVSVERMELWIRGVTPEPFGLRATRLDRGSAGDWRLSDNMAA